MKIYTTYYSNYKNYADKCIPVRVSCSKPYYFEFWTIELKELYPDWKIVDLFKKGAITWEQYSTLYLNELQKLGRDWILNRLKEISEENGDRDIALLCWEGKDKPCHRHLIAEFLDCGIRELS